MLVNELVMDEAYFKQLVEDLGGRKWLKSVIEESDAARKAPFASEQRTF